MSQHILVTGSEGYIGTVLVPLLQAQGYAVTGLDAAYYAHGNLDRSPAPTHPLIRADIRDVSAQQLHGIDAIVHLAGLSNDPLGMLDESLTLDINHHASERLAVLAQGAGIRRFVFASSCSLYGAADKLLTEDDPANPQTAYGKSKILTEDALRTMAGPNFCPVFLRNATAFGFSPRMRFDIVVNSLTAYAHTLSRIQILGDGTPWRPLVHVRDICQAILLALAAPADSVRAQAFNIGSDRENYQIRSIAEHVQQQYPNCEIAIAQDKANDTRNYMVSFDKAQQVLGFQAQWTLNAGIAELKEAYGTCRLDQALFEAPVYTRLKQIEAWLASGHLDSQLRWTGVQP